MNRKLLISLIASLFTAASIICGIKFTNVQHVQACGGTVDGIPFVCQGKFWTCIKYTDNDGSVVKCKGRAETSSAATVTPA